MSRQQELGKGDGDFEEARIFYRQVKTRDRLTQPTSERIESPSELSKVDELLEYIHSPYSKSRVNPQLATQSVVPRTQQINGLTPV